MKLTESDILYENGDFWICKAPQDGWFEVYQCGITHSKRVASIGFKGTEGFERAKNEADRRANKNER